MRRTMVRTQEELDDIEDNKWRRKSYALAQHNALPIPMPLPVYPPPKPCPPPSSFRPPRTGPRPPFRPTTCYRPSAGYRPSKVANLLPVMPEILPTLSEVGGVTPEISPRNANHILANPNRALKAVRPPKVNIPPVLTTARPLPPTPTKSPAESANSTALPTKPSPRLKSPPALPTNPPPITRKPVSQHKYPPSTPKILPPSLASRPPPPQVSLQPPQIHPQPEQASMQQPQTHPQPEQANLKQPQTHPQPEQASLQQPQTHPQPEQASLHPPRTHPQPQQASLQLSQTYPPLESTNPSPLSAECPPAEINPSQITTSTSNPSLSTESLPIAVVVTPTHKENPPTQTDYPPPQASSPPAQRNPQPVQVNPPPELARTTNPLLTEINPPTKQTNPLPEQTSPSSTSNNNNLPPTPTSQDLPPTPTSLSRSPTPTSLSCPRTPTSIRAAPWQPYFPPTPLSRTPRMTPTLTSVTPGTSPTPSSKTSGASPVPIIANSQVLPPTPPSSTSHVGVGSVTPASSVSSLNHVTGQSKIMERGEVQFIPDMADASSKLSYPAVLDVNILNINVADKVVTVIKNPVAETDPNSPSITTAPQDEAYQTYSTRFWILAVFSLIAFLQTVVWGTFGPISESALVAFPSWTEATIAAFPNWGPIIVVLFTIPMMWLTQKLGLRLAVLTCAILLTIGTVIRCFSSQETPFTVLCHISSILFAFAACMTLSLPAMVAATWFPPNERITATAVGALMCQLGGAAMYMGALVVRSPSKIPTNEERAEIRSDIMILMYIPKPPTPPSASSATEKIDFFSGIKGILNNVQQLLVIIAYAFSFGIPAVWIGVLNLSLIDIQIHQEQAIGVAVTAVVCSSLAAFITARITDKVYGHLRVTIIGFLVLSSLFFLWFLLLSTQVIVPSLAQVYVAVAGGVSFEYATMPVLVELAIEIGYPIPESVTGAILTFCFNLVALVFLGLYQINSSTHTWVSWVLFACVSLTVLPLLFVKETHKRSDTDRKYI
ncbi:mucin-2-like isoform X2 [Homarus americanus]|uniref:mucin-2-like isoform X2 n=1 Tax=Homarus americanus TaxID=6706 RepID=UPI001C46BF49|nr:mucin-2-like isoform X2 [Homarus americanus]